MTISNLKPTAPASAPTTGMDRRIERPRWWRRPRLLAAGVAVLALVAAASAGLTSISGNRQSVVAETLTISTVSSGIFEDYVPVRGRVTPSLTVYLDSIEGGRVEKILAEDGAGVRKGQLLAVLSNTALQFDVIRSEAEVAQQLNNLRAQEIALERNRLDNKRSMIETELTLDKVNRQLAREQTLADGGWVAASKLKDTRAEAGANSQRLALLRETQRTDLLLQQSQLAQLRESAQQLQKSLLLARANLDALNVRAPVDGQVSAFNLQIGQSISRGERIGQIDSPGRNKVQADIDEYYLGRVVVGQAAQVEQDGKAYAMKLAKIYPNVKNGNFQVDLAFAKEEPANLRRGQTLDAKLTLSDPTKARLIPNGSFYSDTGGAWVFVVSADGSRAVKRAVKLGRRNSRSIEVLEGLEPGEHIITSPYTAFLDRDRLDISAN
jgi:HlyD family secretion protein